MYRANSEGAKSGTTNAGAHDPDHSDAGRKTVSNPEVEISFVKGPGDTTRITSADGYLEVPPYDSALTFYRVRYGKFKADMMGLFLNLEFSGMITPEIRKWWIEIDTPPFSGRKIDYDPAKIPYLFSIYLDEKGHSGITVIP